MQNKIYNQIDGVLLIDKDKDWTSFDVVAKVRNLLNVKKVGHTGTLDPKATGLLILCIGKATKLVQSLTAVNKEYICDIRFGASSTTDDIEGEITENPNAHELSITEIESALEFFNGSFEQIPPQFSAKKINGKRAYKLAREGKKVELKSSLVTVYNIELLDYKWPNLKIKLNCSKGFYVRSLARDLGDKLQVSGFLSDLRRTKVGNFSIESSVKIEDINLSKIIPIHKVKV